MARLTITPQDVKRNKVLDEGGWHEFRIEEVKEELNKNKDAMNIVIDFVGLTGDAKDVPIRQWFSEKAPGIAIPFIEAMTGEKLSEDNATTFDFDLCKGRTVRLFVEPGKDNNGVMRNQIKGYAPTEL